MLANLKNAALIMACKLIQVGLLILLLCSAAPALIIGNGMELLSEVMKNFGNMIFDFLEEADLRLKETVRDAKRELRR